MTLESAHLNYLSGDAQVSLWERVEENPPGACCEAMIEDSEGNLSECQTSDWQLVEAGPDQAVWKCRNCESLVTQEDE